MRPRIGQFSEPLPIWLVLLATLFWTSCGPTHSLLVVVRCPPIGVVQVVEEGQVFHALIEIPFVGVLSLFRDLLPKKPVTFIRYTQYPNASSSTIDLVAGNLATECLPFQRHTRLLTTPTSLPCRATRSSQRLRRVTMPPSTRSERRNTQIYRLRAISIILAPRFAA